MPMTEGGFSPDVARPPAPQLPKLRLERESTLRANPPKDTGTPWTRGIIPETMLNDPQFLMINQIAHIRIGREVDRQVAEGMLQKPKKGEVYTSSVDEEDRFVVENFAKIKDALQRRDPAVMAIIDQYNAIVAEHGGRPSEYFTLGAPPKKEEDKDSKEGLLTKMLAPETTE